MTLHHGPAMPAEQEDPVQSARRARIGVRLFLGYMIAYGAFVLTSAFAPQWMAIRPAAEINLAIWFGFGLIGAAGAVALIYAWLCRAGAGNASPAPGDAES